VKRVGYRDGARFLELAVRYLARSDKSKAEIIGYLLRRGASRATAAATVRRLERLKYVDEARDAGRWAERRLTQKPMGRLRMKAELLERGFSARLVEETIERVYGGLDEDELAARVIARRRSRQSIPQLSRFLERRGFTRETIVRVLGIESAGY
jgi:regulatory protein